MKLTGFTYPSAGGGYGGIAAVIGAGSTLTAVRAGSFFTVAPFFAVAGAFLPVYIFVFTAFIFIGESPARSASSIPARTFARTSAPVSRL